MVYFPEIPLGNKSFPVSTKRVYGTRYKNADKGRPTFMQRVKTKSLAHLRAQISSNCLQTANIYYIFITLWTENKDDTHKDEKKEVFYVSMNSKIPN
jgi:hypothetical protein